MVAMAAAIDSQAKRLRDGGGWAVFINSGFHLGACRNLAD
jgi:hypothetical protein